MLVTSRSMTGKCPVCGVGGGKCNHLAQMEDKGMFKREITGGKMVVIPIRPGVGMQMNEDKARARGLWPPKGQAEEASAPQEKKREPPKDKKARPEKNKGA